MTYIVTVPYYEYTDINGTGGPKLFKMKFNSLKKARQFKRIMSYIIYNWGYSKLGSFIANWAIELLENHATPGNFYTSEIVKIEQITIIE